MVSRHRRREGAHTVVTEAAMWCGGSVASVARRTLGSLTGTRYAGGLGHAPSGLL